MNVTTVTAEKSSKEKTVLIDCSLRKDSRAVPGEAVTALPVFWANFMGHCLRSNEKMVLFSHRSVRGHVAFVCYNSLAICTDDILDEVTGKTAWGTIGDDVEIPGDTVVLGLDIIERRGDDIVGIIPDGECLGILAHKSEGEVSDRARSLG